MKGILARSAGDAGVAQRRALISRGQEGRAVIVFGAVRQRGANRDEAGQVLILGAQAIGDPRAHAGTDERVAAGVQFQQRPAVAAVRAVHRMDDAQFVGHARDVRKQFADPGAALAVLLELPRRLQQVAGLAGDDARLGKGQRLAVIAGQAAACSRTCRPARARRA